MKNEIDSKYYIFMAFLCALFFACGYKVGDSSGYKDGYNEGYRYDCKEEIASIYKQVKAQNQFIESVRTYSQKVAVENDYIKNAKRYEHNRKIVIAENRRLDSLRRKYELDSAKYSDLARKYDDSLAIVTGFRGIVRADGSADSAICALWSADLGNLAECKPGWHVSHVKRGKGKKKGRK